MAGEGELLDSLRERAGPLGDRIRFLGWCADIEQVYAGSDVVMLTSDNEGMPVSLIEAAAVGIPAVTTRVGSAPEVVLDGVTGLVTATEHRRPRRREPAACSTTISCGNVSATRRGSDASEQFGAARLVDDIARLYEQVAAR